MRDEPQADAGLARGIGPWQATALNVTMIVGAGVFATIPLMLGLLPGPYALLGWVGAGALILVDGLIWSELGAALPGSGGSYHFLLECYGRDRWGRLMAFLFIWQFLISGPLEVGSGLAAIAQFTAAADPRLARLDRDYTWQYVLWEEQAGDQGDKLTVKVGPSRLIGVGVGAVLIALLFGNITRLGKLAVTFWLGVMGASAWLLLEGWARFQPDVAFAFTGPAAGLPPDFGTALGKAMILAMYSYLGYYTVCYVGDEVREPGRTIPRAILASALIVCGLFVGLHLAMLGTVPWAEVPPEDGSYNLPADFMRRLHGDGAAAVLMLLLVWSCAGSAFAGMLSYSRIPYGAARNGHFFGWFAHVHPRHRIPHRALLLVGGMTLFWGFFDLSTIINALITTRIIEQFLGQAVGVMLLRRLRPDLPRPYRMPLYPLPCLVAMAGWAYLYASSGWVFMAFGAGTLGLGVVVFLVWARRTGGWPFAAPPLA